MFGRVTERMADWRRRRRLARIRREFADCGYPLDEVSDSEIEAALTGGNSGIVQTPITAKSIYFALRRLL